MDKIELSRTAHEHFEWIATLLHLAKKEPLHANTLLDIAESLADEQASQFAKKAQQI